MQEGSEAAPTVALRAGRSQERRIVADMALITDHGPTGQFVDRAGAVSR